MAQWDGQSKGNLLGYKIFVFFIKKSGIRIAYGLLIFVALYYFLTAWKSNKSSFYYFRHRQRYSLFKSIRSVYWHYFIFGQVLIDKVAIRAGLLDRYTFEFDGIEHLKQVFADQKGGILISAHLGNFEVADRFLDAIDLHCKINLVTSDLEHSAIKNYLESVTQTASTNYIIIREDLSHIFEINNALSKNELICLTGDRYFEGNKCLETNLLGAPALFPSGPFLIASKMKVPIVFVYVMKEKGLHYHFYARLAGQVSSRDPQALLEKYTESVSSMVKKYPYQWFNFFQFWKS